MGVRDTRNYCVLYVKENENWDSCFFLSLQLQLMFCSNGFPQILFVGRASDHWYHQIEYMLAIKTIDLIQLTIELKR